MKRSGTRQESTEELPPLVTSTWCDPMYITAVRDVVLEAMCETPVLVSAQTADIIKVLLHENVSKHHVRMTPQCILQVQLVCSFYITVANFGIIDASQIKHDKVAGVAEAPREIFYVEEERFSYPSSGKVAKK